MRGGRVNHLVPPFIGVGFGLMIADGMPVDLEKVGFGGLSAVLIWWITQQLSKQIEGLRAEIRALAEQVSRLPCDKIRELEAAIASARKERG